MPLLMTLLLLAPPNLQYNGDLELVGEAAPPPGFTMWGADQYKVPANFTRDETTAHGGRASLRLHHPAGTAGYLVTDPQRAVGSAQATAYHVAFWARADRPATGQFRIEAYQSIAPFVGAGAMSVAALPLTTAWQRFEFTVTESLDFFADEAKLLMLVFVPCLDQAVEMTMWVDDIVWTARPAGPVEGLVNPATLAVPELDHRLTPGDAVRVTIDAAGALRPVNRLVGGVSCHRLFGWTGRPYDREGRLALEAEHRRAIRELRLPLTRFYAVGDEPIPVEQALDRLAALLDDWGIPQSAVPLELETQGATSKLPPEVWARAARHAHQRGYGFRMWEITNEPWVPHPTPPAFPTADDYLAHVLAVSPAIRAAQPEALVGLAIQSRDLRWGNQNLRRAVGAYDWVTPHLYDFTNVADAPLEQIAIAANAAQCRHLLRLRALIDTYNPERRIPIYDTEWGLHSRSRQGGRADEENRNGNIVGALHRAVRLIYYLREGLVDAASGWEMFTFSRGPGFGFLFTDRPDTRGVLYWLHHRFGRLPEGTVVSITGTAPYDPTGAGPLTPLVACRSADGQRLWLMMVNASAERTLPVTIRLSGFAATAADAELLRQADLDVSAVITDEADLIGAHPVTLAGDSLTFELPSHAILFAELRR